MAWLASGVHTEDRDRGTFPNRVDTRSKGKGNPVEVQTLDMGSLWSFVPWTGQLRQCLRTRQTCSVGFGPLQLWWKQA